MATPGIGYRISLDANGVAPRLSPRSSLFLALFAALKQLDVALARTHSEMRHPGAAAFAEATAWRT
jgi:hypothetical protein